jgi:putative tryptophan/tyrosine transport system substrate-binding protein
VNRRVFITLLGGGATFSWPLAASAQQQDRTRRVGVLMPTTVDEPEFQMRLTAFLQALAQLGWIDGRNIRIDIRWGGGDAARIRRHAAELVALMPDAILAPGSVTTGPLLQATRTIPIVFATIPDPVGAGFVASLSRPGGNATGFSAFEYGFSAKWLELLKQIAPALTRVAVLRDSDNPAGIGQFTALQSAGSPLGVEAIPINLREIAELDRALANFARSANGGMIVTQSGWAANNRGLIVGLAARDKLPAIYAGTFWVGSGGLMSYSADRSEQYQKAAAYIDRILKGEKPADLPVQAPTKYEFAINLKTAKSLGITVPPTLLAHADEVIE